jgi:predicted aspartyl protease
MLWGKNKMPTGTRTVCIQFVFILLILNVTLNLQAEFYKYVDKEGQIFYVDDLSQVPLEYRKQVEVYPEKYDHLPEDQKKTQLETDQKQQQALELERQHQMERDLQQAVEQEEAERQRQAELAQKRNRETPVIIKGNRVFVPTMIGNNGVEVETLLLLDTGASQTVIHREIASQLNIIALKKGLSQVAGGQQIYTEMGKVDYIKIGPHKLKGANILIINHEGAAVTHNGLLGMNILRKFNYNIDFENQVIVWQPVQ